MRKNKVITQIKALSEKELKLFGRYIKSSSYGKKEITNRLYKFIVKHYPDFNDRAFTKKNCFQYIFPELKLTLRQLNGEADDFISKRLKNPFYILKNLIDDFIVNQELSVQKTRRNILLIEGLFKRGMHQRAVQLTDKELDRLKNSLGNDFYHHFYQFQLLELKLSNTLDQIKTLDDYFKDLHNQLDLFFTHSKIKLGFEVVNRYRLFGKKFDLLFYEDTKEMVEKGLIPNTNTSMILYSKISCLNDSSTNKDFIEIKEFYIDNFSILYKSEQKEPLIYLLNFSTKNYNRGKVDYLNEMFDLYKFGLKHDILMNNGYLTKNDFLNIIVISTTLKNYNWAKEFINSKSYLLPIGSRKSTVLIAKAQVSICLKNFTELIELLKEAEFNNIYDNLTARSLLVRAYYGLNEFVLLPSFLESFHKYVNRNKLLSESEKLPFINMIKFTKILVAAHYKKKNKTYLKKKLEEMQPINCKSWIKYRIDEL